MWQCKNRLVIVIVLLLLLSFPFIFSGCIEHDHDYDDEGLVRVCNYDNHEYLVVLYRDSNDRIVDEFWVDEWYDHDRCEEFDDINDGRYYIAIYRDDDLCCPWDVSGSFYIDDDDYEGFHIDEDGDIHRN